MTPRHLDDADLRALVDGLTMDLACGASRLAIWLPVRTVREGRAWKLAAVYGRPVTTINSYMSRAGLPSLKMLAYTTRLVLAARAVQRLGLSVPAVADWLRFSSPQALCRTITAHTGRTAGEYLRDPRSASPARLVTLLTEHADRWRAFDTRFPEWRPL